MKGDIEITLDMKKRSVSSHVWLQDDDRCWYKYVFIHASTVRYVWRARIYINKRVNKTFVFIRKYTNKFLWKCLFGANTVHLFSHINVTSARVYSAILHNSNCNVTVYKHMHLCTSACVRRLCTGMTSHRCVTDHTPINVTATGRWQGSIQPYDTKCIFHRYGDRCCTFDLHIWNKYCIWGKNTFTIQ